MSSPRGSSILPTSLHGPLEPGTPYEGDDSSPGLAFISNSLEPSELIIRLRLPTACTKKYGVNRLRAPVS